MSITKPISAGWQNKFDLVESINPQTYSNYTKVMLSLPFMERLFRSSMLGFFFGPFYYIWLGMWRKAIFIILTVVVLGVITDAMDITFLDPFYRIATAFYCSRAVMFDYYNKVKNGDNSWFPWLVSALVSAFQKRAEVKG
jgi:hypothetical protein